jgi:hypothetical protein
MTRTPAGKGVVCVLTLITCAYVLFSDRFVPSWLVWVETAVIVGLMAVLAYGERRVSRSR